MKTPLRKARAKRDLTQEQAIAGIGITQSHYSRLERGVWSCSSDVARKLARRFAAQGLTELHILYPRRFRRFEPT